MAKVAL